MGWLYVIGIFLAFAAMQWAVNVVSTSKSTSMTTLSARRRLIRDFNNSLSIVNKEVDLEKWINIPLKVKLDDYKTKVIETDDPLHLRNKIINDKDLNELPGFKNWGRDQRLDSLLS